MKSVVSAVLHGLIFFAFFSLEVTVHAKEKDAPEAVPRTLIEEPTLCLRRASVCALENTGARGFELKLGESTVVLDTGAAIVRRSNDDIRLIKGTIWVQATSAVHVTTEFGTMANASAGDFWISRSKDAMTGSAISTTVLMTANGGHETLEIVPGLENTIGAIAFDGKATTSVPTPVPFKDHLIRWARLYRGPKPDFEAGVDRFHAVWANASVVSAEVSRTLVERKIATVEAEKAARQARARKAEAEKRELHELFRRRSLGEM